MTEEKPTDSQVELLRAEQVYDLALHAEAEDTGSSTPGFARRAAIRAMMAFGKGPVACNYPAAKPDEDEGLMREALHLAERALARARQDISSGAVKHQMITAEHAVVKALAARQ